DVSGLGDGVVTILATANPLTAEGGPGSGVVVRPTFRTDALAHVQQLRSVAGPGVWLTEPVAKALHVEPGDMVTLTSPAKERSASIKVVGVYRDLAASPLPSYWVSLTSSIAQLTPDSPPPPSLMLATDLDTMRRFEGDLRDIATFQWEFPLQSRGL